MCRGCEANCKYIDPELAIALNNGDAVTENLKQARYAKSFAKSAIENRLQRGVDALYCFRCLENMLRRLPTDKHLSPKAIERKHGHELAESRKSGKGSNSKKGHLVNLIPGRTPGVKTGIKN